MPYLELSLAKRVVKNLYDKVEEKKLYDEKSDLYALRFVLAALFPELYSIVGTPIDFCTPAGELHGSYQAKELEQHETFGNENAKLIAFINSLNADNVDKRPKSAPQALKRLMKIANLDYGAEYQIANVRPLLRTHVESVIKNLNTIKNEDNSYGRVCKNTHAENVITKSKAKTYQHNSNYKTYLESLHKLILSVKDKTGLFSFLDFAKSKKTPVLKALANKCDQMLKEPESISIEDMHNISKTFFHIAMQRRNFGFSKITTTAEKIVNLFNTPEYEDLKELLFSSFRRKGSDISYYHLTRFVCGPTADIGIFRASNAALLFQNCRPLNNSEEKINFDFYQKLNVGIA